VHYAEAMGYLTPAGGREPHGRIDVLDLGSNVIQEYENPNRFAYDWWQRCLRSSPRCCGSVDFVYT
jgi:hypothetical protein